MTDSSEKGAPKGLGDWARVAVFAGIIMTVPMLALLGSAIYAALAGRAGASTGILLSIVIMLLFWAIIWGGIWMISGLRVRSDARAQFAGRIEELERENERLQKLVTELSGEKQL
jgi:hypothetical protein